MDAWKRQLAQFRMDLVERPADDVRRAIAETGIAPMPVADQMRLQWEMIRAGVEQAGE
jgi:hypothetical protein